MGSSEKWKYNIYHAVLVVRICIVTGVEFVVQKMLFLSFHLLLENAHGGMTPTPSQPPLWHLSHRREVVCSHTCLYIRLWGGTPPFQDSDQCCHRALKHCAEGGFSRVGWKCSVLSQIAAWLRLGAPRMLPN